MVRVRFAVGPIRESEENNFTWRAVKKKKVDSENKASVNRHCNSGVFLKAAAGSWMTCVHPAQYLTWAEGVGWVKVDGEFVWHLRREGSENKLHTSSWKMWFCFNTGHFSYTFSLPPSLSVHRPLSFVLFISSVPWQHRWVDSCVIMWIRMYNAYSFICVCGACFSC